MSAKFLGRCFCLVFITLAVFCCIFVTIYYYKESKSELDTDNDSHYEAYQNQEIQATNYEIPESWNTYYSKDNSYSIAVPPTVELRRKKNETSTPDSYPQHQSDLVVFQQKGLSQNTKEAHKHYCRIMIKHYNLNEDCVPGPNEEDATIFDKQALEEMVYAEVKPYALLSQPTYKWVDIAGKKAIEVNYRRKGINGNTTNVTIYLLFNHTEIVKIIISYREQEAYIWKNDFDNIINTFNWIN